MLPLARSINIFPENATLYYTLKTKIHEQAVLLLRCLFL